MDAHVCSTYLREAAAQCDFALNAIKGLQNVTVRLLDDTATVEWQRRQTLHAEVFRAIHSFLTHASNVSRLFWPAPPRRQRAESRAAYKARCLVTPRLLRAHALRGRIGLPAHGHVLRSRRMRDHLEHFDERLDDWQATSKRRNLVQDYIGPPQGIVGMDAGDMMRCFDPSTGKLRFRGEEYDLTLLAAAVAGIQATLSAALADPPQPAARPLR